MAGAARQLLLPQHLLHCLDGLMVALLVLVLLLMMILLVLALLLVVMLLLLLLPPMLLQLLLPLLLVLLMLLHLPVSHPYHSWLASAKRRREESPGWRRAGAPARGTANATKSWRIWRSCTPLVRS